MTKNQKKKIQDVLKTLGKHEKLDPKKGSRYGYICYLMNVREILGEEELKICYERFKEKEDMMSKMEFMNEESRRYFEKMIPS